ncbi:MAG: hypothetical protein R3253_04005 [Longimicrobiales bacterium]|nr:hypothetical protein [Longimicrobiales bacterium]
MIARVLLLLMLGTPLVSGGGVDAQSIRGRIVDSESAEPVVLAYVGLLEPGRELVAAVLADRNGTFSLTAPVEGEYFLYIERAGYRTVLDGLYELGEEGVIEVAVGLSPQPVTLEPVVVGILGRREAYWIEAFDRRREAGLGHFILRHQIEARAVENLADAMKGIPRLIVTTPAPSFTGPSGVRHPELLMRSTGMDPCSPSLFVDGHLVAVGGLRPRRAVRPDDFVDPTSAEAVEVYTSPAEIPVEFETGTGCGVVVIWTR